MTGHSEGGESKGRQFTKLQGERSRLCPSKQHILKGYEIDYNVRYSSMMGSFDGKVGKKWGETLLLDLDSFAPSVLLTRR